MDPAGAAGAGVAWPARGGPGDGRRELSSPPSLEPPYKKVRNNAFQAYPSQEETRGDGQGGISTHAASDQSYGAPPFNHSQGYGGQQQTQMPSNGYAQNTSHASSLNYNTPPSGFPPGSAKGTGALFLKTKLCTKFKLGTCTFDDRCHFAHGMEDLRKPPVGWETMVVNAGQGGPFGGRSNDGLQQRKKSSKPCRFFADGKECPYGDRCTFVHASPGDDAYPASGFGNSESGGMPPSSGRFKTRMCARWERGEPCNYGERCHYAHGYAELQSSTGVSTYGNDNVTSANNVQYPSSNLEVAPYSTQFLNSNTMNAPPAATPPGGPFTIPNTNAPPNAYPTTGTGAQEVINDYPKPQSYWNGPPAQGGYAVPQAGYVQANQAAGGWVGNHIMDGGYSKEPSSAVQYVPAPIQQQPGVQPYASGNAGVYQEPKQIASVPYVQDGSRSNYQTEAMAGKGGYYPATY